MNKDGGALNDEGFVSGKISKLVNDNIDDLFETPAPIEADKELDKILKEALLQLFEKESEIVEFPYEVGGEYERPAISLSKLRELLGGAK